MQQANTSNIWPLDEMRESLGSAARLAVNFLPGFPVGTLGPGCQVIRTGPMILSISYISNNL